jgi:hypothetical protein
LYGFSGDYAFFQASSRLKFLTNYNIIANSSYSWWAAWLNGNENKTIIAPRQWYQDPRAQSRVAEMIPKERMTI